MGSKPRLVLLNRYFAPDESATSRLLTDLAIAASATYAVVAVTSRQLLDQPGAHLPARERLAGVDVVRVWSTRFGRGHLAGRLLDYLSFLWTLAAWLILSLRRGDLIVAKTDPPLLGVLAAAAARLRGARLVHWLQDLYPETAWQLGVLGRNALASRLLLRLRDWSLRRGVLCVVPSGRMATRLLQATPQLRVEHIANWSDDHGAGIPGTATTYRAELGLSARFVVGYSGNLGRAHQAPALEAAVQRWEELAPAHFLFTGGGMFMERLRALAQQSPPRNWSFLPYQPRARLPELLATADVHLAVLDARVEGLIFPSKVAGILAAGRPCLFLGEPDSEVAAVLEKYGCGLTVSAADFDTLKRELERLRTDANRRAELAHNARRAYEAEFERGAALARWMALLAEAGR